MNKFTINRNRLTPEEIKRFTAMEPGYVATGDTITCEYTNYYGQKCSDPFVLFKAADAKHRWTQCGMARQTSKYIIIARHDRYWKLTLNGEIVSLDAKDDNSNR